VHAQKRAQAEDVDDVDGTDRFIRLPVVDSRERIEKQSKPIRNSLCHGGD